MGVYIYTMRSKTLPLYIFPDGDVQANLYSFAYRYTSYWKGDRGYNSYNLMVTNAHRHAHEAFAKPRSGYVIVGDLDDGKLALEGRSVYKDVTEAIWTDTGRFPGTLVGWVGVQGKRLILTDRTPWGEGKVLDGDTWKPYKSRLVLIHGVAKQERIVDGVHTCEP
jgi:hypothetical protein